MQKIPSIVPPRFNSKVLVLEDTTNMDKLTKDEHKNPFDVSNEEEANFVRKIKRGCGKYKGELPFKCFECGRVRHFTSKYPFKETKYSNSDEELDHQEQRNVYQQRRFEGKRKFPKQRKSL